MKPGRRHRTGRGSPFGAGVKAYWAGLAAGACAIRPLTLIDTTGFRCAHRRRGAGDVRRLGVLADARAPIASRWPPRGEALDDAGLDARERAETALVVGAVGGGMLEAEAWYWARARGRRRRRGIRALRSMLPVLPRRALGHGGCGLGGPRQTVVTAVLLGAACRCAEAADLVADGRRRSSRSPAASMR